MAINVKITARDLEVTDAMRGEVEEALRPIARRLQAFPADLTQTDVVVDRVGRSQVWQVRVTLGAGAPDHTFTSTEQGDTLEQAVAAAADDIVDQVERFRDAVQRREQTYDDVAERKRSG